MSKDKTEKELLSEINDKINKLIGLIAVQGKNKEEQIRTLHDLDFTSEMISTITGIPQGTVGRIRSTKLKRR